MKNYTITIDIEPTWKSLLHLVAQGVLPEKELYPAVEIADYIRQAQKKGYSQVIVTLGKDDISMEEVA